MSSDTFRAVVARKTGNGQTCALEILTEDDLPQADVTVDVDYSAFNYKDGLGLKGLNRILRTFPMVPGIDFAGTVRRSESPDFVPGDRVVLTGWGVGESWSGGFAERARVKSDWLVKLPKGLNSRQAMILGTAGFTAGLCVSALREYGIPAGGEILVTGASGGVGSVAVRLLSRLGYRPFALTGRPAEADYLKSLGAAGIVDRAGYAAPGKPLQTERWDGAVDSVGGAVLVNVLANLKSESAVAACGLAGSTDLPATVFPFILRGVSLLGINSVTQPRAVREKTWAGIANTLRPEDLEAVSREVALDDVFTLADEILSGRVRGRTVVKIKA